MSNIVHVGVIFFSSDGNAPFQDQALLVKRDSTLQFVIKSGEPLCLKRPYVMTNYPASNENFSRVRWRKLDSKYEF